MNLLNFNVVVDQIFFRFSRQFMEESISQTNEVFGGLNPKVLNVIFIQGEMDPRRNLGPPEDLNQETPSIVMSCKSRNKNCEVSFIIM